MPSDFMPGRADIESVPPARPLQRPIRADLKALGRMSQSQPFAVLLPVSEDARAFKGLYGPRLFVRDGIVFGRNPHSKNSVTLASNWLQVSSNHCTFSWDSKQVVQGSGLCWRACPARLPLSLQPTAGVLGAH